MQQKGLDFGAPVDASRARPRALTVSELTDRIQGVLEVEFADVWVEGEVSNLKIAPSGHWYFSLKDDRAQVRAVVWKTDTRLIRFRPRDGMKVLARGQVRVYAPRGEYQISVQVLEPLGKGSLQQAFEELKERLGKEGLFDAARKRPLPMLPRRIGVVSSPTGAVVQDILRVLRARYVNLGVLLYPARVQGPEAAGEVAQGIRALSRLGGLDVLIVARGGGSLEDLWAFNDEQVARALSSSKVPTICAVGHETDFTIADFVADLRAPTPSAAAERVVQAKEDLVAQIAAWSRAWRAPPACASPACAPGSRRSPPTASSRPSGAVCAAGPSEWTSSSAAGRRACTAGSSGRAIASAATATGWKPSAGTGRWRRGASGWPANGIASRAASGPRWRCAGPPSGVSPPSSTASRRWPCSPEAMPSYGTRRAAGCCATRPTWRWATACASASTREPSPPP